VLQWDQTRYLSGGLAAGVAVEGRAGDLERRVAHAAGGQAQGVERVLGQQQQRWAWGGIRLERGVR
jgi:hypothetical protein